MFVHDWRWERRQEMMLGWSGMALSGALVA